MNFLKNKRKQIDKLDKKMISLLERRFKIVNELKKWKKKNKIPMGDKKREKEIKNMFGKSGLGKKFISDFYDLLFREAKR